MIPLQKAMRRLLFLKIKKIQEETTQEEVSEDEAVPADESDAITDFETAYKVTILLVQM